MTTSPALPSPGYLDLKALAAYSSCSVRWLRDRLNDSTAPLPYHRVGGKILIRREDFDDWITRFRTVQAATELETLVDDVMADLFNKKAS
ncbi:MAG: hypothetical protein OJF52_003729 [Nitrospira sp.]|nr:MAG: hypothetical protein OJF52_003729 [Nitrospira sp.]